MTITILIGLLTVTVGHCIAQEVARISDVGENYENLSEVENALGKPFVIKNGFAIWNKRVLVDIKRSGLPPIGTVGYICAYQYAKTKTNEHAAWIIMAWEMSVRKNLNEGPLEP